MEKRMWVTELLGQVPNIESPSNPNAFIVGALTLITVMLTAGLIYLVKTFKEAQGANTEATSAAHAVNHIDPGDSTLHETVTIIARDVAMLVEAQKLFLTSGWGSLPKDINTGSGLTEVVRQLQHADMTLFEKLAVLDHAFEEHMKQFDKLRDRVDQLS
jgi:hypothetical protein